MILPWEHPFTSIIGGPTSCGKSVFVTKFLENVEVMIDQSISEIIWCYGESQQLHDKIKNVVRVPIKFVEGLPNMAEIIPEQNPPARLLVVDDLMRESDSRVLDVFSKGSHHRNLSVVFITQNIFHQGKGARDMSLNTHYIVFFKNPRDKSQIFHFSRQVSPENAKFIQEAFVEATSKPHSYLVFDMKQSTPEAFRFRSEIFPNEGNFVYVPKLGGLDYSSHFAL